MGSSQILFDDSSYLFIKINVLIIYEKMQVDWLLIQGFFWNGYWYKAWLNYIKLGPISEQVKTDFLFLL